MQTNLNDMQMTRMYSADNGSNTFWKVTSERSRDNIWKTSIEDPIMILNFK